MQLEDISVKIRPRNPWEAMDLGLVMARKWWKAVFLPWLIISSVIFLTLSFIFSDRLWLAYLIFWWLKPFYDRVLLHIFSQALFAEPPTLRQTLNTIPGLFKTGLFINLTFLRINVFRSFHLPVWQLEGLRGKDRRERINVLSGRTGSHAFALTVICILFEILLWASLLGLIALFTPADSDFSIFDSMFSDNPPAWFDIIDNLTGYIAILIIEPIYVAAGFMLYINRRTQLEGWDIELAFRRINNRLKKLLAGTTSSLLAIIIIFSFTPQPVLATENNPEDESVASTRLPAHKSPDVIEQILQRDEFSQVKQKQMWLPKKKDKEEKDPDFSGWEWLGEWFENLGTFFQWMATSFRALLWLSIAVLIGLLIIYRDRWLHLFTREKQRVSEYQPPEQLFGLEINPESLPDDIAATAREKLLAGKYRDALGLLYRGALSVMINQDRLELDESHTEGDVLNLASPKLDAQRKNYLQTLTRFWQQIAYAHRNPDKEKSLQLCEQWIQFEVKP